MKQAGLPIPQVVQVATLCLLALALAVVPIHAQPVQQVLAQSVPPTFQKSFAPATIGPGSISTLRFDITNGSSLAVRNLAFTDTLPAGVTIASPANTSSTCLGVVDAPEGGSTITFAGGGIGSSSSCSVTVDVTSSTPGTHTNVSGDLTSDAGNSGSATADLTVATNRPGFTKAFAPSSVNFGGRSTLTFTIDNTANGSTAFSLTFTDNLPSGMVVASPANASSTCNGGTLSAPAGGSVISLGPDFSTPGSPSVAAGASCTVSVDVLGNAVGSLGNTSGELTSTSGGPSVSSGKAGAVLTVTVDRISLTKSFTDDPVPPGGTVTLEFTLRNLDRASDATSITFTDDLDATLSGLVAIGTPIADPCGPGSSLSGTSVLTLSGGNLPLEASCTFSVTLQVPASAASGSYYNETSTVSADVGGRPVTSSAGSDLLVVSPVPLLTKTFVDDPVGAGGSVTLEFTITNTSPTSAATDIAFEDVFDVVLATASATPANGFCGAGSTATFIPLGFSSPTLVVSGASLDPGASCTFDITLDVTVGASGGIYPNTTSEITATVDGETVTGSAASDDLEIVSGPTLVKEFTDDPVAPGGTVTLQFTLAHNEGAAGDATDVTFTDDLDAALSGLVATGLPMADVCGVGSQVSGTSTLTFSGGTLTPGETCTFSVTLQVPSTATAGNHTNTTSSVVSSVLGVTTVEIAATDDLRIAGLTLAKEFIDDPVLPGGTVTLRFTIENVSPVSTATDIFFQDDLNATLSGLAATGLPLADVCGTGSSLIGTSGDKVLTFAGGTLASGEVCSFDVTLDVPLTAEPDTYLNTTSDFSGTFEGQTVLFDNASAGLVVANELLAFTKEFVDDPVGPGDLVTLRFTLTNLSAVGPVADVAFTDDLDAALSGLAAIGLPATDVCGLGSEVSGTSLLSFTGGSLAAGGSCSFDVMLMVPSTVDVGSGAVNTTSEVTGTLSGLPVTGPAASDTLVIDTLAFTKAFGGDTVAGGTVVLTFNIQNLDAGSGVLELRFSDDLSGVIPGLVATGLPAIDVCGEGSILDGTSIVTLLGGNLLPGGSCSFSVTLQVPASAAPGSYLNVTSDLLQGDARVADPATATLTVLGVVDSDGDGVLDDVDVCPGTVIPEGVPTQSLGVNRFALVNGDGIFDTTLPNGKGPGASFTIEDTAGCSCEQIIAAQGLGKGHEKFGCSLGAMREWVALVNP